jgi:iron complex outermembrane receptor protein
VLVWLLMNTALVLPLGATELESDDAWLAEEDFPEVSIATGSGLPLSRTPAVASVITADDIEAMGATDIDTVLETVPGVHLARSTQGDTPLYVIRGINLGFNPQVLMLINGVPITTVYTGNRGSGWGGLPIQHVARIEVIRGPGSALYGADAFAGVINVITKTASEIGGSEVGLKIGSFHTQDAWFMHGGSWGAAQVATFLRLGRTEGHRRTVEADAQTGWDAVLGGSPVSLAPGPVNHGRQLIDGHVDLSLDAWRLRMAYRARDRVGAGSGVASALDPNGSSMSQNVSADLSYEQAQVAPDLGVKVQASVMHYKELSSLTLFPAGFQGFDGNAFQDGLIGSPAKWERNVRLGTTLTYTGWIDHRVMLGLGADRQSLYKATDRKNFNVDFSRIGLGSTADVADVTEALTFIRPHARTNKHLYVQDEWRVAKDWTLTSGVRHDETSDFGSSVNPRLALVWDATYNVTAKLLYGSAYRAPSFVELYSQNNPVVEGNPNLKPEKIRTLEAAITWQPDGRWQLSGNVFHYAMRNLIRQIDRRYENIGRQNGQGLEIEASYRASPRWMLKGNYSLQRSVDKASDRDAANAPKHQLHASSDWRWPDGWSAQAQLNWISERPRVAEDDRDPLEGYETLDLTLRKSKGLRGWDMALSVHNVFDADVREPTPYDRSLTQPFVSIPNDFPQAGRSVSLQATYRF